MGDNVGPLLEGPGGPVRRYICNDVGRGGRGARRGEDSLPVLVFGASKLIHDWVTLGHLSIDSDAPVPRFLNKNKVRRRRKG